MLDCNVIPTLLYGKLATGLIITTNSHASFHSSLILLLRACKYIAAGARRDLLVEHLAYAGVGLQILATCKDHDIVALRFFNRVCPLYQRLIQIADDPPGTADAASLVSLQGELDDGAVLPEYAVDIVRRLVDAMSTRSQDIWV